MTNFRSFENPYFMASYFILKLILLRKRVAVLFDQPKVTKEFTQKKGSDAFPGRCFVLRARFQYENVWVHRPGFGEKASARTPGKKSV